MSFDNSPVFWPVNNAQCWFPNSPPWITCTYVRATWIIYSLLMDISSLKNFPDLETGSCTLAGSVAAPHRFQGIPGHPTNTDFRTRSRNSLKGVFGNGLQATASIKREQNIWSLRNQGTQIDAQGGEFRSSPQSAYISVCRRCEFFLNVNFQDEM